MVKLHFILAASVMLMPSTSRCASETLGPVYDAALAGDGVKAIETLSAIDVNALDSKEASRANCIRSALLAPPQHEDALPPASSSILLAYRTYWQDSRRDAPHARKPRRN